MHTIMMTRQPVKVTYAHKRSRVKAPPKTTSSPLEDLSPDRDNITRAEMSRRMLKRSRRISSHEDDDQIRPKGRAVKRARQTAQTSHLDPLPLEPSNINTFQTPFPPVEYVHPSSVTRPLVPEYLSPVPHAKRILSRTSSRNMKENSTSLPLASPFHSRPSSPHLLPPTKAKTRSYCIPLYSKSSTLPGALQKNDSNVRHVLSPKDSLLSLDDGKLSRQVSLNDSKLSRKYAMLSLNELARNTSSKHQRHTSSLNPAYMLSHISQQDWISQPETGQGLHIPPGQMENSFTFPFLADRPQFCSTPQHRSPGNRPGLRAPKSPTRFAFLTKSPRVTTRDQDVEMENYEVPKIPKIHIPSNSIISSSGSFTLRTRLNSNILEAGNGHNISDNAGSAPMSISADVLPQKVLMDDYVVPPGSSPFRCLGMDTSGPHDKISLGHNVIPLPGTSALVSPAPAVVSTRTVTGRQSIALSISSPASETQDTAARNARECIAEIPLLRPGGSSGTSNVGVQSQADLVQDMLSLGLGGKNHDARSTQLPERTRSLDRSPCISSKKPRAAEHNRNRGDTIRASDFARPTTSGPILTTLALTTTGRTRSGTVVGPNSKLAVPLPKGAAKKRPVIHITQRDIGGGSVDDLAILNVQEGRGLRATEDLNYVGLARGGRGKKRKGKVVHDTLASDDPLLITGPWKDEDWF